MDQHGSAVLVLPLLAIAGLSIKDIIGFCLVTLIVSGVVLSLIFLLL